MNTGTPTVHCTGRSPTDTLSSNMFSAGNAPANRLTPPKGLHMSAHRLLATSAPLSRRHLLKVAGATLLAGSLAAQAGLAGCKKDEGDGPRRVVIGTLATEDFLPVWVAQEEGLFNPEVLDVQVQVFQSATELQAGIKSGQVHLAMTDPMVTAGIFVSGTNVRIQWITLGTTAAQGRFGIMVNAENHAAGYTSLKRLADMPIGVGSNTILEYVMDTLMARAGVAEKHVKKTEVQKLPLRYQNMMDGVITAAALPASLLALGEANGCVCVADDTTGDNISQSVMIARADWLDSDPDKVLLGALMAGWNEAVGHINASPDAYRALLVEKANLNEVLAETYPVSTYPGCQLPTNEMIDPVLDWMSTKGYLEYPITYDAATGAFLPAV